MKWEDTTWYNRRGLTNFYTVAIEPRLEFVAKGRQTPKEVSLGYNRRGLTNFYTVAIIGSSEKSEETQWNMIV